MINIKNTFPEFSQKGDFEPDKSCKFFLQSYFFCYTLNITLPSFCICCCSSVHLGGHNRGFYGSSIWLYVKLYQLLWWQQKSLLRK